jgi:hypothetical protein
VYTVLENDVKVVTVATTSSHEGSRRGDGAAGVPRRLMTANATVGWRSLR